jgi:hypothetical protein
LPRDRCRLFWGDCLHDLAKIRKHHETGNFASPISTLKQIEETLEKLKRYRIQIIKPVHNLQLSPAELTINHFQNPRRLCIFEFVG